MSIQGEQVLTVDEREALFRPTETAHGLPGRVYFDPEIYERERLTVFTKYWVAAGFGSDIPESGDVMPVTIAGRELILVRTSEGTVKCFHNLCRHRGMKLVSQAGNMRNIRCPYHSWVYSLQGELKGTPAIQGIGKHSAPSIEPDTLGLVEVRSAQWFDIIFINIDGAAEPFDDYIKPVRDRLEPYFDFSLMRSGGDALDQTYPVNWKIVLEGGIEDYHLPFVHRALSHSPLYQVELGGETYGGFSSAVRPIETVSKRFIDEETKEVIQTFPVFPKMQESGEGHGCTLFIYPSLVVTCDVNVMKANISHPRGPTETEARIRGYFIGDAAVSPEYAPAREQFYRFWTEILGEDDGVWKDVQSLTRTRSEAGVETRFSPHWEQALHNFQRYWATHIEG